MIDFFGIKIKLHESHGWEAYSLVQAINRHFALWVRKIEDQCNDSADQILSDMCKDSIAYCTGYHKGADVMKEVAKRLIKDGFSRGVNDQAQLLRAITDCIDEARKLVPAPNPDDEGFGRT